MTRKSAIARRFVAGATLAGALAATTAQADAPMVRSLNVDARAFPCVRTTDERFQSFQVGFSHLTGGETWKSYDALPKGAPADFKSVREARGRADLANRRLRNLTAALAPLYIRFSGTTANSVYFHDSEAPPPEAPPAGFTVILTRQGWKGAVDFAKAVGARIVTSFANSEGVRDEHQAWTSRMAGPWLAYTRSIGGRIAAAELYNEPNAPEPPRIPRGKSAQQYADDFAAFRAFMAKASPRTLLAGPGSATMGISGVSSLEAVTPDMYAGATPAPRFGIVSYHFYPALAERCAPAGSPMGIGADRALAEDWLARPDAQFQRHKALRDRFAPGAPIWLTETGGAACGGLRWQPTFLNTFRYLDTQARLAKQGLDAIFTHALISGSNRIIDEKTFEPNASYWAAVLWRRLMGARVLDAGPTHAGLHVYAHCLRGVPGGVAVLALNLQDTPASLQTDTPSQLYALSAPDLQDRSVLLNGRALAIQADDTLPALAPVPTKTGTIPLAPTSIAFLSIPRAGNPACR